MTTLLQLNTSLNSASGLSSHLAAQFAGAWMDRNPGGAVVTRDLASDPVPHLTAETFQAFITPAAERTAEQQIAVDYSDSLIDELRRADVVALGLPMYNFGVPSALKAYFDHVARAGVTFRYTASGPEGLLKGKRAIVFATRGGMHAGTSRDTETQYVREFLAFVGITDVEFVYAEGLAMGDGRDATIAQAQRQARALAEPARLAA